MQKYVLLAAEQRQRSRLVCLMRLAIACAVATVVPSSGQAWLDYATRYLLYSPVKPSLIRPLLRQGNKILSWLMG